MKDKTEKPAQPIPDVVGMILGPLAKHPPSVAVDPDAEPAPAKQQQTPRDKQYRGGKNKGR